MSDPQKEAREIAERHGIKAYEPPAETGNRPGCECRVRKVSEECRDWFHDEDLRENFHMRRLADDALSDPCSCEQLREQAQSAQSDAFRWMKAHDGILGSAAQMVEDARAATNAVNAKLAAAQSLLEEAREALKPFGCKRLAIPDDFTRARSVLAKIEASRNPEVKP